MQENFQREEGNEKVGREIDEALQDLNQDHEKDLLEKELHELRNTVHQNELEEVWFQRDYYKLFLTVQEKMKENIELERELSELKQEKDEIKRELCELKQTVKPELEKDSGRKELYDLGQTMPQNETKKEKEIDRMRREKELHENKLDALQNEQESNRDNRKTDEVLQDKESAFTAAEHSESQIHAVDYETSAKAIDEDKTKILTNEINEAFQQFFGVNQAAKVVIPPRKTDELEEKKHVKLSSKEVAIFKKEGIEFASSDDESNE